MVALMAADVDKRVRGVWATVYGGDVPDAISTHRLRVVNGENDQACLVHRRACRSTLAPFVVRTEDKPCPS
jgi:hypothetical protein